MEVKELLWKALDIYRDHGGGTGQYLNPDTGKVCLNGALYEATRTLANLEFDLQWEDTEHATCCWQAEELVLRTTCELFPEQNWGSIEGFNDASTQEMCETVLHKTALKASEVV